jgi:hypothetical protein
VTTFSFRKELAAVESFLREALKLSDQSHDASIQLRAVIEIFSSSFS